MNAEQEHMLRLICAAAEKQILRKLVLSLPADKGAPLRYTGRLCRHRAQIVLLLEASFEGGRVAQELISPEQWGEKIALLLPQYRMVHLLTAAGDAELRLNRKAHALLRGAEPLDAALGQAAPSSFADALDILPLEHKKQYLLQGDEPFLHALGITDATGRIHDKRRAKFRQIHRFLEHLATVYGNLPAAGTLTVYDLCCGKSYLSFAVYHYLHCMQGRDVRMVCIDRKADVIAYCASVAKQAGFDGMQFLCGDIRRCTPITQPDLLISLHACDTATDIVLAQAIALRARVILATPCCHRALSSRLNCKPLAFVTDFPHLRNKLAETLTDALRLLHLQRNGYAVSAVELTDPDDTPKNTLLRAILQKEDSRSPARTDALNRQYQDAIAFLLGDGAVYHPEDL